MTAFRWGIFGTGAISFKFVAGLAAAKGAKASFIASRSLDRARSFADAMGIERAFGSYDEAAAAGGVDAIYVATPPAMHAEHALAALRAGIPVLVEKPFASTAVDAARIAEAARAASLFAMEAMWTRFLPAASALRRDMAATVGQPRIVAGNFGTSQSREGNGIFDPTLGGGAVSHLGVYPLALAQWLFGTPLSVDAIGTVGPTGVDEDVAMQLCYEQGVIGSFFVSIRAWAPDDFRVMGSHGMASFRGSIVRPHGLELARQAPIAAEQSRLDRKARLRQSDAVHRIAQLLDRSSRVKGVRVAHHYAGNGYHYEADEVRACVERGLAESPVMPLADSVAVAATADAVRRGVFASAPNVRAATGPFP